MCLSQYRVQKHALIMHLENIMSCQNFKLSVFTILNVFAVGHSVENSVKLLQLIDCAFTSGEGAKTIKKFSCYF